jgi:hypothetical protein
MSAKMAAMLAFLVGAGDALANPVITEIAVPSDGDLLVWHADKADSYAGSSADLRANIVRLFDATQGSTLPMSEVECRFLLARVASFRSSLPVDRARRGRHRTARLSPRCP